MADKKKRKDKDKKRDKDKKKDKDDRKKNKKGKSLSDSSDDDSSSSSASSVSNDKRKKRQKQKKIKKKDKKSKKQTPEKQAPQPTNFPYDFNAVPTTLPGIKNLSIPAIPPPLPNIAPTATVAKPKSKQPNIFKLLPKLPCGAVLFAKTIYSGDYLSEPVLDKVLVEMTKTIEKSTKEEQHKKGSSIIAKCISELDKVFTEQRQEQLRTAKNPELFEPIKEKSSRYQNLQKVYRQSMEKAKMID